MKIHRSPAPKAGFPLRSKKMRGIFPEWYGINSNVAHMLVPALIGIGAKVTESVPILMGLIKSAKKQIQIGRDHPGIETLF